MQQMQEPSGLWQGGRAGCWSLTFLSIPAQFLAFTWMDVYMQGYESWRDSLWCVTAYLAGSAMIATVTTLEALRRARTESTKRPVCVFIIARLLTISGIVFLPIAVALARNHNNDWPDAPMFLYFIPLALVVLALLSGLTLMRMWRWARVGSIGSIIAILLSGAFVARSWFCVTATTPADWLLPFPTAMLAGQGLLFPYLAIAAPLGVAAVWCLTRRGVAQAFSKEQC